MTPPTLAPFLKPDGLEMLHPGAALREASVLTEAGRYVLHRAERSLRVRSPYAGAAPNRAVQPVVLVPGFLAGDASLAVMAHALRVDGIRTYRSHIHANIGCTLTAANQLEARVESIVARRGTTVRIVGHSLGGMLARTVAARRPDLVSGIVTLGSPMLGPGAHHPSISAAVEVLVRLSRAGMRGLMAEDCIAGECARQAFEACRAPLDEGVEFTAIYSPRDGVVDHRACIDPQARAVEVRASHIGMAIDPRVIARVREALSLDWAGSAHGSLAEVDSGEIA